MRLYQRNGWYYVEIKRGKAVSLKTKDGAEATKIYKRLEKKAIEGRLKILDESERITLEKFKAEYLETRQHLSAQTIRADELSLRLLGDVVGHSRALKLIDDKLMQNFVSVCLARGIKPVSVNSYLRHIKAALNQAERLGYIKKTPYFKPLKTGKRIHRILDGKEIKKLLSHARAQDFEMWRIIQFALWTATRRSEIVSVRWENVSEGKCRVIGKGDKERNIQLREGALEAMGEPKNIGPVFHQFHIDTISHRFKSLCDGCGIQGVKFHSLRHTSATHMLSSGMGIEAVQKILGHSDLRTTQIYAEILDEVAAQEIKKLRF